MNGPGVPDLIHSILLEKGKNPDTSRFRTYSSNKKFVNYLQTLHCYVLKNIHVFQNFW